MLRPRTRWTDYIEDLGWNRLRLYSSEMMEMWRTVMRDKPTLICSYPRSPHGQDRVPKKEDE